MFRLEVCFRFEADRQADNGKSVVVHTDFNTYNEAQGVAEEFLENGFAMSGNVIVEKDIYCGSMYFIPAHKIEWISIRKSEKG